jgi:hypothetical protein
MSAEIASSCVAGKSHAFCRRKSKWCPMKSLSDAQPAKTTLFAGANPSDVC